MADCYGVLYDKLMKRIWVWSILVLSVGTLGMSGSGEQVIVPMVEDIRAEVAIQLLERVGLQAQLQSTLPRAGYVVRQEPRPGVVLPAGGTVTLVTTATGVKPTGQTAVSTTSQRTVPGHVRRTSTTTAPATTANQAVARPNTVLAYQGQYQGGQATVLYQPQQTAVSRYLIADPTPRFYPAWYPRRFITLVNNQSAGQTVVTSGQTAVAVSPVQPYPATQRLYPAVSASTDAGSYTTQGVSSGQMQRVGVFTATTQPATPVPNVQRLLQADATRAITKAGLTPGRITRIQSALPSGTVVKQSPQPRTIVETGTTVNLWIAE
jgi:hypothetical protein